MGTTTSKPTIQYNVLHHHEHWSVVVCDFEDEFAKISERGATWIINSRSVADSPASRTNTFVLRTKSKGGGSKNAQYEFLCGYVLTQTTVSASALLQNSPWVDQTGFSMEQVQRKIRHLQPQGSATTDITLTMTLVCNLGNLRGILRKEVLERQTAEQKNNFLRYKPTLREVIHVFACLGDILSSGCSDEDQASLFSDYCTKVENGVDVDALNTSVSEVNSTINSTFLSDRDNSFVSHGDNSFDATQTATKRIYDGGQLAQGSNRLSEDILTDEDLKTKDDESNPSTAPLEVKKEEAVDDLSKPKEEDDDDDS